MSGPTSAWTCPICGPSHDVPTSETIGWASRASRANHPMTVHLTNDPAYSTPLPPVRAKRGGVHYGPVEGDRMTAIDMLDQIEARHIAWHDSEPEGAEWSDLHGALSSTADATADELAMAWELARNDVPALVDALRAAVHVALGENTEEWVRAARGGAMIAAADVLEAIEEKLS